MARLVAIEARVNPSSTADACLALLLDTARRREHRAIELEVRAILETETGPGGPAVRADAQGD